MEWKEEYPLRMSALSCWMTDMQRRNANPWLAHWSTQRDFTRPLICSFSLGNPNHTIGENATSVAGKMIWDRRWESSNQNWQPMCFLCLWARVYNPMFVYVWWSGPDYSSAAAAYDKWEDRPQNTVMCWTLEALQLIMPFYWPAP